jgi:hypothetical protein
MPARREIMKVNGKVSILGKIFNFETDSGYGLVKLGGSWSLVKFSCPFETLPPSGAGDVVASTGIALKLEHGGRPYLGEPVAIGQES